MDSILFVTYLRLTVDGVSDRSVSKGKVIIANDIVFKNIRHKSISKTIQVKMVEKDFKKKAPADSVEQERNKAFHYRC